MVFSGASSLIWKSSRRSISASESGVTRDMNGDDACGQGVVVQSIVDDVLRRGRSPSWTAILIGGYRLGPDLRLFDLPAPKLSLKVQIDVGNVAMKSVD